MATALTPAAGDVLIWEHGPVGRHVPTRWNVTGGVNLPLRSYRTPFEAYHAAKSHAEAQHLDVWIIGELEPRMWKGFRGLWGLLSMATENCTLWATENCTLRGESCRAAGTFSR